MIPGAQFENTLAELVDPKTFRGDIDAKHLDGKRGIELIEKMLLIRRAEETIGELVVGGEAKCPCHLGIGQEAIAAGISEHLSPDDRVFSGHRSHAHYLALGGSLDRIIAEIMGRATGASNGMGGSMHLYAPEVGFQGSVPIVAGTVPMALGAAFAARMDNSNVVAVSYFGDGAAEEGVVHETMNLAATMQLPILFVCENNLFSSHLDLHLRQPENKISRYAVAHAISARVVDGNDVLAVSTAAGELISAARKEKKPGFLEAITFRHRGHVGPNEDIDVGVRRRLDELKAWKHRDPIVRLQNGLIKAGKLNAQQIDEIAQAVNTACREAVERARSAPFPPLDNLLEFVYKKRTG